MNWKQQSGEKQNMKKENEQILTLDNALQAEMKDPAFADAWQESSLEYEICRMLIRLRTEKGYTQKELSAITGIRQSNISRIENGTALPTIKTINTIAKSLGMRLKLEFVPLESRPEGQRILP